MKTSRTAKTSHQILVADSIWSAFEQMAHEMGSDQEGLINQAMFMFARLNGFLLPIAESQASLLQRQAAVSADIEASADGVDGHGAPAALSDENEEEAFQSEFDADMDFEPNESEEALEHSAAEEAPAPVAEDSGEFFKEDSPPPPARRSVSPPRRSGSSLPPPRNRRLQKSVDDSEDDAFSQDADDDDDRKAVAERVLETAAELERLIKGKKDDDDQDQDDEGFEPEMTPVGKRPGLKPRAPVTLELYLVSEDEELEQIEKSRYIIGRGKHCDMVINSGKVSREHAVITKENGGYFIEDLGSSNGTWFKKQRIKKQQIEDGDEFYICADRVKFALR